MKLRSRLFYSYLLFLIVYAGFTILPAPPAAVLAQYHVSATNIRFIDLTIILLVAAIWFAGFYGYAKLHDYASLIKKEKDGKQVTKLAKGVFLVVMWLPVSSTVAAILNYVSLKHIGFLPAATIIKNYVNLALPFLGFVFIGQGARGLRELVGQRLSYHAYNISAAIIIYIGLIYYRLVVTTNHRILIYHLSIWLILLTIAAPYIYMWNVGLLAAYDIYLYQKKVAGIVYRKSWSLLTLGIGWLIVTSIGFQYLTSLTGRLQRLSFYWILAVVYALLLVLSVGFVLIALGTRHLQRLEEV